MLNWSETFYSVILFISILFEILMCGGIVYGWASVLVIFKAKQFYFDLCKTSYDANRFSITEEYTINTMTDGITIIDCSHQDDMLNLVFTTTMSVFNVFQFPAGLFIDKFGPKVARMIGGPILITGCMGLTFITRGNEEYLFPSFIAIAIGGIIITLTVFQVFHSLKISNTVLWRRRAIVMCSLNGAFDSSAVVLLIFKLLHDVGVELHHTLYVYSGLSSLLIAFITIFLVPSHDKLKRWSNEEELECSRSFLNDSVSTKQLISTSGNNLNNERENYSDLKADDSKSKKIKADGNIKEIKADSDMKEIKADGDMKEIKAGSDMKKIKADSNMNTNSLVTNSETHTVKATFLQSIFTPIYIIELVSVLFIHLRLLCFIGSLQLNLERLTQNNTSEVSKFINLFGYLQFFGIFVTPIIGLTFTDLRMIDKQHLEKEENYIHSLRTSVIPYCITNFLVIMLCLFDLIDSMKLQVPLYILCTTVRGFLYANHATFIGIAFPQYQFTTLLGFSYLLAGLFSILQYFFFYLTIHVFEGNPFWSNLILLFLVFLCNAFPVYVWWFCRQKEALFKKSQQQKFNVQCSSDSESSVVPATNVQSLE